MKILPLLVIAVAMPVAAQSVVSDPIGFNKVTCLTNSDTIVGVPFRLQGSLNAKLASAPVTNGDTATLTLTATTLTAGTLTRHYVKFTSGGKDGFWYDITGNTTDTLTVNLNGDNLTGAATGDAVVIAEFWTLDTLFPPTGVTTDWTETPAGSGNWVPNGNAIVKSPSAFVRRSEVLVPNLTAAGINLSASATYYVTGTTPTWIKFGTAGNAGQAILYPDNYIIIRNPSSVAHNTVFKSVGEVEVGNLAIPLSTRTAGKQDNFIGIPRPVAVSLQDLGLDTQAFVNSASAFVRADELLVFNNDIAIRNRSASATYYRLSTGWKKFGDPVSTDHNGTLIPAGAGFIIRKAATATGATVFWKNPPSY